MLECPLFLKRVYSPRVASDRVEWPSNGMEGVAKVGIFLLEEGVEGAGAFAWALGVGNCPAFLYGSHRNK